MDDDEDEDEDDEEELEGRVEVQQPDLLIEAADVDAVYIPSLTQASRR